MLLVYYTWTMKAERNYGSKMKKKTHLEFLVEFEAILGPNMNYLVSTLVHKSKLRSSIRFVMKYMRLHPTIY